MAALNISASEIQVALGDVVALLSGQPVTIQVKPEDVSLGQFGSADVSLVAGGVQLQIKH